MKRFVLGCLAVLALSVATQATARAGLFDRFSTCGPCDAACDPCDMACGKKSRVFVGGHLEAGFYANEYGRKNVYQPGNYVDFGNNALLQNVRNTGLNLNQGVIYAGVKADGRKGWSFGGRADFMFGTDAYLAQSQGLEFGTGHAVHSSSFLHANGRWGTGDYFSALSQMYFEAEYKRLNIKVGKFLTPMGHEGVYSTDRFFYSLTDAFGMLPVAQSGALFTYTVNSRLTVFGGWVQGDNMFFDTSHNNAFLGGLKYDFGKRAYFKYSALIGRDTQEFLGGKNDRDSFIQSFIVGVKPGKRWDYTFEWTVKNEKSARNAFSKDYDGRYGFNNELIYTVNKKWAVGLRAEWSHEYESEYVQLDGNWNNLSSFGDNKYTFTLAANWTPRSWLTVRPELRYDRIEGTDYFREKDGTPRNKQLSGGVSAIVKY